MDFSGLSAFPLTPLNGNNIDWPSFSTLVQKLADARVNAIGGLRVIASAAELIGEASADCLPSPLQTLSSEAREELKRILHETRLMMPLTIQQPIIQSEK